jgi:hypothetical protein
VNSDSRNTTLNLTASAIQSKLRPCARKNSHWTSSSTCPMTQPCLSLPRNCTRQQFVRDWMNSIRVRVSHTTRLSASSTDGLQNNLVAAGIGGPAGGGSVYSPRQPFGRSPVWGETHNKSRKSHDLSGARASNQEVCRPECAANLSGTFSNCLSHPHEILIGRNCSDLARGSERREFRAVNLSARLQATRPICKGFYL